MNVRPTSAIEDSSLMRHLIFPRPPFKLLLTALDLHGARRRYRSFILLCLLRSSLLGIVCLLLSFALSLLPSLRLFPPLFFFLALPGELLLLSCSQVSLILPPPVALSAFSKDPKYGPERHHNKYKRHLAVSRPAPTARKHRRGAMPTDRWKINTKLTLWRPRRMRIVWMDALLHGERKQCCYP